MPADVVVEFCSRMFDDAKRMTIIERKVDMKARTGKSPDLADAVALVVEMARRLGGYATATANKRGESSWDKLVLQYNSIYDN